MFSPDLYLEFKPRSSRNIPIPVIPIIAITITITIRVTRVIVHRGGSFHHPRPTLQSLACVVLVIVESQSQKSGYICFIRISIGIMTTTTITTTALTFFWRTHTRIHIIPI